MATVFLSYARTDDEPFVADLYRRLTAIGFTVWWDRANMPSRGLTFLREIREAISSCDRFVVVLGPGATRSEYVRAEWQHALVEGKPVTPVLRLGEYGLVPPELQAFHAPDLRASAHGTPSEAALARLEQILFEPAPPLALVHGEIPASPPHFQPRTQDLTRLAQAVLVDDTQPVTLASAQRITVLHGMSGLGKTVLAAAFARSSTARRAFPDGVYWLVVGEQSTPLSLVRQLLAALHDPTSGAIVNWYPKNGRHEV